MLQTRMRRAYYRTFRVENAPDLGVMEREARSTEHRLTIRAGLAVDIAYGSAAIFAPR